MMAIAFFVGAGLQIAVIEIPVIRAVFSTRNLSINEWIITLAVAFIPLLVHEIIVIFKKILKKN